MNPVLEIRNLSVGFETPQGIARAVDGVSLSVREGETVGLVGESGSGKTVTALSILRLLDPPASIAPESVIAYRGTNILTLEPADLRRIRGAEIAMVFQEQSTSLNPVLRVGTQITETLHAHRDITRQAARSRAIELLDLVGIPDAPRRVHAYPHELSGGMQQRVMIAMALSCEPSLLIADEPTTALDVTIQAQILSLLADLRSRLGMAMILITHDLGVVAEFADRIAVMYGGQLVEQAPTRSLFAHPAHPYTEALLAAMPRLDRPTDRLKAIPGSVPPATAWPAGCRFHPRCSKVLERCASEQPPMLPLPGGQHARCWLHAKEASDS